MARGDRRTLLAEMRLEQDQANYVRKVLGDSAEEIEEKLAKIGTSGNPLTRMQLEAQRSAIKSMLDQDFKDIEKSIAAGKIDAAKTASQVVSKYENQLLKAVVSQDAMRRIARSEAQRTVNNLDAALKRMQGTSYNTLSKQVYKTKQLSAGWVDDIINKGLVSGWSAQQLAKAVVPSISPNVPGGVSYAANRLARTEINNAYHAASWDRYNRSAIVDEVEWMLSSSHPEDDICNDYALESPFKKNAVPAKPHPNCYCYIMPRLPTEEEFLDRLFAGEYGDEPWADEVKPDMQRRTAPSQWDEAMLKEIFKAPTTTGVRGYEPLRPIMEAQGYGTPKIISQKEYDKLLSPEIYRGLASKPGLDAADMAADFFKEEGYYIGSGIYGNGWYFAGSKNVSQVYAGWNGDVSAFKLAPDAKILNVGAVDSAEDILKRPEFKWTQEPPFAGTAVARDPSMAAAMMGYDAVIMDEVSDWATHTFTLVLNRSATVSVRKS